ncbi:MAG: NAD(P)-dependent glycerol-3-phosphate dehydrogenase [Treponema sp.]|jgi:glycerol-3-phosphate dehydrogenase (NAD(P)+)|nr:NAD(P)-dependent glycerol-3-phosphate dehydrogenase [Treponema sp.]
MESKFSEQIAILGSGAWGTAVAQVIANKGHEVVLWAFESAVVEDINNNHCNSYFLPGVLLPEKIRATNDLIEAATARKFLIFASPSLYLLSTVKKILTVPSIREGETIIAVLTKGFLSTARGPRLIVETLEDYLPGFYRNALVYIAGPSHAEEVSRGKITGLIAASENPKNSIKFRDLLKSNRLLVFSSFDVKGVQTAAAAKNVIAIVFGMLDALRESKTLDIFGDGTESLLLAAGLNEIQALGSAMGSTHPQTFSSISGVGDLDVTCRSIFGRNRRFGKEIIENDILKPFADLDDLLTRISEIGYLPEGIAAAKYVKILANKYNLKMPISLGLYDILNKTTTPLELFERILK